MDRLDEKAEKLRLMSFSVTGRCTRPARQTEGLIVNGEHLDEQFVNQLIAGEKLTDVIRARELWLSSGAR
jgi:hypothetical protein